MTDKFAKGAVDANEVFSTYLAKSIPVGALEKATVELAAFATDVVGFTAFETAIALFDQVKNLPENEQPQKFTEILWGHFKDQGYNLGQIKIVSHLVMWMSGSRGARMASTEYLKQNLPQLNGATIEQMGEGYRIKLRSGAVVECKNATEMLSSLNLMVRGETVLSGKFVKAEELNEFNKFKTELEIHRKVLGFNENEEITPEKLKLRYRELAKKCHSDRGGNDAMMAEINLAHEFYTQNLARINNLPNEALRISQLQKTSTKSNPTNPAEANSNLPAVIGDKTQVNIVQSLQGSFKPSKTVANSTAAIQNQPIKIEYKTGKSEICVVREEANNIVKDLYARLDRTEYPLEEFSESSISDIRSAIRKNELALTEAERNTLVDFVNKNTTPK